MSGVAVHGHFATYDQVGVPAVFGQGGQAARQGIRGGKRVGSREGAVGEQKASVCPAGQTVAQQSLGVGDAHGQGAHAPSQLLLQAHGDFEGGLVEGIDDALAPVAYECVGHGVHLHLSGGGDRLDANDGVHRLSLPFGGTVLPVMGGRGMGGNLGVEHIGPKEVALP